MMSLEVVKSSISAFLHVLCETIDPNLYFLTLSFESFRVAINYILRFCRKLTERN